MIIMTIKTKMAVRIKTAVAAPAIMMVMLEVPVFSFCSSLDSL
jgi:hypothetical protein